MDLATIIGMASGFGIIALAIASKPGAIMFFNLPSLGIVLGGTIAATFITFPLKEVLGSIKVAQNAFHFKAQPVETLIEQLVELSRKARVEGLLALEKDVNSISDDFIKKGLQLMVDGTETNMLRDILTTELSSLQFRHATGQAIFQAMGVYAPAFGMAGTLVGLIQMLQQLNDPTKIGAGMAVAMVTTFYGVIFANLVFLPIAGKLKTKSTQETLARDLAIEGVCAIQAGDNPRLLRDKLVSFIAPDIRDRVPR